MSVTAGGKGVLWVGAAGTNAGFAVVQAARRGWPSVLRLVGADVNPSHLVAAALLCDEFVQVPPVSHPEFGSRIIEALGRCGATMYWPILDEEIEIAGALAVAGRLGSVTLIAPPLEAILRCRDKLALARHLAAGAVRVPPTWTTADAPWLAGGVFVKPRAGRGSVGARHVRTASALDDLRGDESLIAQPVCAGPEVTVDAFRSARDGQFRAVCRERLEVKAGVCTKARIFLDEEILDLAARTSTALGLIGLHCLQVMRCSGELCVTDVNPRPGAGTRMSAAVGLDFYGAAVAESLGEDPLPFLPPLERERFVVRQFVDLVTG